MYAVVRSGGKQYAVSPGTIIHLEHIEGDVDSKIKFDEVLLVDSEEGLKVGQPSVEGVPVVGKILRQYKDKKVLVVKKRRRKGYRRTNGHRQLVTEVEIISVGGSTAPSVKDEEK
ncbi:MAG: 50S ribosomal protein L21 [Nitrospinota bacterium]